MRVQEFDRDEWKIAIQALKDQGIAEGDIAVVSLRGMMYPGNIMHAKELGACGVAPATE